MVEQVGFFTECVEGKCVKFCHLAVTSEGMPLQSYLKRFTIIGFVLALFVSHVQAQFYDGSNVTFGKNRVQYRSFNWQYFPSTRAEVYYYQGGKPLASRITAALPEWMEEVEEIFDRRIDGGVQLLVFNKQSEFRQSNIGVASDEENNIGGTAMLVGSKVFAFGQQEWSNVEQQIKSGLAQLLFNQIMYGGNWQEALRNTTATSFPVWFSEGLASYVSKPWNADVAIHIGDAARSQAITHAHQASANRAPWIGHAVWKYIADIFGPMVVSNTLYMTRVSRSLEKGFQYATGMDLALVLEEANRYHLEWDDSEALFPDVKKRRDRRRARKNTGDLPISLKGEAVASSVWFHSDGDRFVWSTEERGQTTIWLGDLSGSKPLKLGKHGHKIDRVQIHAPPAFAWHPNGQLLSYTIEDGPQNQLITVNIETLESSSKDIFQIDKILSMDYAPDGRTMIWSGLRNGQSDLYLYQVLGNNQTALWNDPYNDLDPVFSLDGKFIWFASNRPTTNLPATFILGEPLPEQHDLFRLNWQEKIPRIEPWTQTPNTDERQPQLQGPDEVTYLAENTDGSQERWVSWRDSAVAFIDTTIHYRWFTQTRLAQTLAAPAHSFQFIAERGVIGFEHQLCEHVYWNEIPADKSTWKSTTDQPESSEAENSLDLDWEWKPKNGEADIRNYQFGPWTDPDKPSSNQENTSGQAGEMSADSEPDDPAAKQTEWKPFELPKPVNYRRNYAIESVTGQLDNSFGTNFYQAYSGEIAVQPGLGGLSRISMSDLFEDRRFTAGFRLSGSLSNSRYMLAYSDLSKRLDRTWILERQGVTQNANNAQSPVNTHIHLLRHQLSYPFDEVRSIRLQAMIRMDRNTPLSTDAFNLRLPTTFTHQTGLQLAYVFDNTRQRMINIREGLRCRIWGEYLINPEQTESTFGTVGWDFRWYKPLWRHVTFAFRSAANWSIGSQKLLTMVGGVDNAISLAGNSNTPIDPDIAYSYQARVTPIRGFKNNARNGAHMALFNTELRIPIWSSLSKRSVESEFLRDLQCVGFADVGSAWNGAHPYDEANSFNQVVVVQNPITVTVDNNREPIIWGTGFGLRSKLLGYWVRADWCWGVDDGRWQDRVFNLSLQLDF